MLTARAFRKLHFHAIQADYYDDPETGKPREIDVSASMQTETNDTLFVVRFCIECKLARDKPWVIFTSSDIKLADPARIVQRAASSLGHALLENIHKLEDIRNLPVFLIPERPGYGLTQSFTNGQDTPYAAIMSAAKAAIAEANDADRFSKLVAPVCAIVFPVVVIDGLLLECYLDERNQMMVEEVQRGILVWRSQIVGMPHTIVHVITLQALDDFVHEAEKTSLALLLTCDKELAEIVKSLPKKSYKMKK